MQDRPGELKKPAGREDLTENQRIAVETKDVDLVVTAGAGAGKTRVLVQRFIGLLRDPGLNLDLDELAAITFTEKAAGEMKERVRIALAGLAAERVDKPDFPRWRELQRRMGQARISTIHSFCARLLRENPVEAGLDPEFVVLDQTESQLLLLDAINAALLRGLASDEPGVILLVGNYGLRKLAVDIQSLYNQVRGSGLTWDEVRMRAGRRRAALEGQMASRRSELAAIVGALLDGRNDPAHTPAARQALETLAGLWAGTSQALGAIAQDGSNWRDAVVALEQLKKVPAQARGIKEDLLKMRDVAERLAGAYVGIGAKPFYDAIFRLLQSIDLAYSESKARRRGIDFTDLELLARKLLKEHPQSGRGEGRRLKFLLVDEFQDTNGLQKEIIELIRGGDTNLFVVGDPKQSIYRFRGAEVEVFARTAGEIAGRGGMEVPLAENFRSRANLVNFVNGFFERVMRSDEDPAGVDYSPMIPCRPGVPRPVIELLIGSDPELSAEEAREEEAGALVYRLREMVEQGEVMAGDPPKGDPGDPDDPDEPKTPRPVRYGDIAMLFRARSSLRIYEKALREAGIPFYTLDGRGFYTTQEVKDVLNFLRVVQDRHNDVALAGALRSPLFGASDDDLVRLRLLPGGGPGRGPSGGLYEGLMGAGRFMANHDAPAARFTNPDGLKKAGETLLKYRRARRRLGPAAIIEGLLADTQFIEVLLTRFNGEQAAANVLKLVNIARGFEHSAFHDLGGFLAHIDTLLEQESDEGQAQLESEAADAVKLLTIHKSKGLEFPVVVLPDLARSLNGGNREAVDFAFEKEIGIGIALRDPDSSRKTPDLEDIEARTRERGFYEDQRLLYVAMTRARDYLLFSGVLTDKNPKLDGQLHELDSWLKWICSVLGVNPACLPDGTGELKFAEETLRVRNIFGPDLPSAGTEVSKVEAEVAATATASSAATGAPLGEDGLERLIKRLEPLQNPAETQLAFCPVTALMTFEQCPRRFYYQDVLGIPERPVLGPARTSKAEAGSKRPAGAHGLEPGLNPRLDPIAKGNITHRVIAHLSYPELADPGDPGKWDGLLRSAILAEGITGEEQIQAASNEIRPLIQNYLAGEVFKATGSAREVKSEVPFTYRCGRVILNGVIDKILVFAGEQVSTWPAMGPATDRALVVDFKTNQIRPDEMPGLLQKYDLQLQTYALVARELFGYSRVEAGIYFPHLDSYRPVVVADSGAIRQRIEQIGTQISRGSSLADYPRKREGCAECSYRRFCG